ncbi:MAG: hypothetical protein Q8J98_01490 [Phaeovulum sp.]|uniref:hypothetical protein n=1 Tax=Phaeovulum sp. TaxID=2934796 RepID=UPI00272FBD60|nr:hypothetical protein [Phaeovulum sp.]MDP2061764.1 hypothetical protein [Phaeovulum sp.]
MGPVDILKDARTKLVIEREKLCSALDAKIADLDIAISALEDRFGRSKVPDSIDAIAPISPIDVAIIEAVRSGMHTPAKIHAYIARHLSIDTTVNSVRTRVSRLKSSGKIARDDRGWIMPNEVYEGLPLNENDPPKGGSDGDGDATPS